MALQREMAGTVPLSRTGGRGDLNEAPPISDRWSDNRRGMQLSLIANEGPRDASDEREPRPSSHPQPES